jgi:hypothetical protein
MINAFWNQFGVQKKNHELTWIHKPSNNLDLKESHHIFSIVYFISHHDIYIKMAKVLGFHALIPNFRTNSFLKLQMVIICSQCIQMKQANPFSYNVSKDLSNAISNFVFNKNAHEIWKDLKSNKHLIAI